MSSIVQKLNEKRLISPPSWLPNNIQYETYMGSHSYGVADTSVKTKLPDYDVYGFAIPPKEMIFPHLAGNIIGFGPKPQSFDQWQEHHVMESDPSNNVSKEWDLQIFGIVRLFELCRENNPNMIDSLFTPESCVIHITKVGRMVRDNRKMFLSKECFVKFRGYAASQLKKTEKVANSKEIETIWKFEIDHNIPRSTKISEVENEIEARKKGTNSSKELKNLNDKILNDYLEIYNKGLESSTRFEDRKINGQDVKFLYHLIRLYDECEQIILHGDIDLQRARETMKAVRRGEWTTEQVNNWVKAKEISLEKSFAECKLPAKAPTESLKKLLLSCLEEHYGSMKDCVTELGWAESLVRDIDKLIEQNRRLMYQ